MLKAKAVFFDFDGVLCKDRFYTLLQPDFTRAWQFVNEEIFGQGKHYADPWMRGQLTYHEINRLISDSSGVPMDKLTEIFKASVRLMRVNESLLQFATSLQQKGVKTALVTNNMDIFNEITVPEKRLAEVFPVIVNSFDYGIMKHDQDGKLFDIALEMLGLDSYQGVWLIDDSPGYCSIFKAKGGQAYQYSGQAELER